jgi:hypothetical protein
MSYLRYLCLFAYSTVQHILYCVLYLFYLSSSCVLCLVSCVPNVVSFSGLTILDCPFVYFLRIV